MADRKIRVVHIITKLELGGAQRNTLHTVNNLDRNRFDAVLISGKGGILDKETSTLKVYFIDGLIRKINPISDIIAFYKIRKILMKENPDIVHTHSSKAGILGRWAAKTANVPVIIHTFHGFGFNDFQNWLVRNIYILSEKITAKITDRFVFVSKENIKTCLEEKIGAQERYILIRSGIKISDYKHLKPDLELKRKSGIDLKEKVVSTIGPFKPQKNLSDFIEMAKIVEKGFNIGGKSVKFIIVGDGMQRKCLEEKVLKYGLKNKVLFLGWRKDIPEILSMTDVFVMTALWEGLPRSVVESMVSGVPVVAYKVDGTREIIKDNESGYLVNPKDINTLAEKILFLLNNESIAKKMSESARSSIDNSFDIDYMVKQQENMYSNLAR